MAAGSLGTLSSCHCVFECKALVGLDPELLRRSQIDVWCGLSGLHILVVAWDDDLH